MTRLLSILLLAASVGGCATPQEFEHEFWLQTDGSGSFVVTAPPWVWNAVKNVGDARNLDATVNEQTVGALFQVPAILKPRVRSVMRGGKTYIAVAAGFSDINSLVGTRAFPDLVVALRREGGRLRMFGVWRRPQFSGTAQGDDRGFMALRFHLPSEIHQHRNASMGVERGNILTWRQDLREGIAGSPIDFGATLGTRSTLRAARGPYGLAILAAAGLIVTALIVLVRRGRRRNGRPPGPGSRDGTAPGPDFLDYDPSSSAP